LQIKKKNLSRTTRRGIVCTGFHLCFLMLIYINIALSQQNIILIKKVQLTMCYN